MKLLFASVNPTHVVDIISLRAGWQLAEKSYFYDPALTWQ